jgi:hypothetical protein
LTRESLDQASAQVNAAHNRQSGNLASTESPNEHANQIRQGGGQARAAQRRLAGPHWGGRDVRVDPQALHGQKRVEGDQGGLPGGCVDVGPVGDDPGGRVAQPVDDGVVVGSGPKMSSSMSSAVRASAW